VVEDPDGGRAAQGLLDGVLGVDAEAALATAVGRSPTVTQRAMLYRR
jgi:hypothetical protein